MVLQRSLSQQDVVFQWIWLQCAPLLYCQYFGGTLVRFYCCILENAIFDFPFVFFNGWEVVTAKACPF